MAQRINNLPSLSQNTSVIKRGEISIYKGELTTKEMINQVKRLKSAFPNAEPGFFDLVMERAKETGFTNTRLVDAVNNVIDNFRYPQPMVSDVISFDRRVKLHSYLDMTEKVNRGGASVWDNFEVRDFDGTKFWIEKSDIVQYSL